jgi:glucose-1-phosphate thymidylyltransferase
VIEKRQGFKIGCLEEIAYRMHFIEKEQLMNLAKKFEKSGYGEYLKNIEK